MGRGGKGAEGALMVLQLVVYIQYHIEGVASDASCAVVAVTDTLDVWGANASAVDARNECRFERDCNGTLLRSGGCSSLLTLDLSSRQVYASVSCKEDMHQSARCMEMVQAAT